MIILLIISLIEINIYSNKDTYLLGEDILVWWEIVIEGNSLDYFEESGDAPKLTNDGKLWDINGREVEHNQIMLMRAGQVPLKEIEPGDTFKYKEVNLIGIFGSLGFAENGFLNRYIKLGEYFLSLFYITGSNRSQKVYSDTLHFFVIEPSGEEKIVWDLYKEFKRYYNLAKGKEMVKYAIEILRKYPTSDYIESLFRTLSVEFSVLKRKEFIEKRKEMSEITRELLNYIETNVDKFSENHSTLKEALWCITYGELMLGISQDKVKNLIIQMNIPVDNEIKEFLKINN